MPCSLAIDHSIPVPAVLQAWHAGSRAPTPIVALSMVTQWQVAGRVGPDNQFMKLSNVNMPETLDDMVHPPLLHAAGFLIQ